MCPIIVNNLTGDTLASVLASVFGLRCWLVVIRVIRCFFSSDLAAYCRRGLISILQAVSYQNGLLRLARDFSLDPPYLKQYTKPYAHT